MELKEKLKSVGVGLPEILFPAPGIDLTKYAAVACDQYSAEPGYWDEVESFVGDAPSSFKLFQPEAWLGKPEKAEHQSRIAGTMEKYLNDGTLVSLGKGMMYLERMTTTGLRRGLICMLDLEEYDYRPGSGTMIRATEKTVEERLPNRISIRKEAILELPHIMVLYSDADDLLMGGFSDFTRGKEPTYSFDLMQDSGHIAGWMINDERIIGRAADILLSLKQQASDGMLFAIGDGNHSLAAAKSVWNEIRAGLNDGERDNHPARYAMVELVNIFDTGLAFEPIHRLLMGVDGERVMEEIGFDAENPESLQTLQPKLDSWLKEHPEAELEYIHGEEKCREMGARPGNLAICWGEFDRDSLFRDVTEHGSLVRKSFSMGAAPDKRFYLEARRITPDKAER